MQIHLQMHARPLMQIHLLMHARPLVQIHLLMHHIPRSCMHAHLCVLKCIATSLRSVGRGGCYELATYRVCLADAKYSFSQMFAVNLTATKIADDQFLLLLQRCPRLRQLDVSSTPLTDASIVHIPTHCKNLQRLSLCMNVGISDVSTRDSYAFAFLQQPLMCRHSFLAHSKTHSTIPSRRHLLLFPQAVVETVVSGLPQLEMLCVAWMELGPAGVAAIHQHCTALRELDISGCRDHLDDEALEQITVRCQRLESLDVSDCYKLSDSSVQHVTKHCANIRQISLSRCHNITVAAMRTLAAKQSLKAINLFGCYAVVYPHIRVRRLPVFSFLPFAAGLCCASLNRHACPHLARSLLLLTVARHPAGGLRASVHQQDDDVLRPMHYHDRVAPSSSPPQMFTSPTVTPSPRPACGVVAAVMVR